MRVLCLVAYNSSIALNVVVSLTERSKIICKLTHLSVRAGTRIREIGPLTRAHLRCGSPAAPSPTVGAAAANSLGLGSD